jgi:hypothetical protein
VAESEQSPSPADRALLLAFRAWGGKEFARSSGRFSTGWRDLLRSAWPRAKKSSPTDAWSQLRVAHEVSSRPDPSRVHPTWFLRALKSESPAVRLAVIANAAPSLRRTLLRGLKVDERDLRPDHAPDPEALGWALALWSERLVGDVPDRVDDPPVVVALTRMAPIDLARLIKVCGVVKHAFAIAGNGPSGADESLARFTAIDRVRLGFFRRHIGEADPRLVPLARHDLGAIAGDRRRGHGRVGLLTFGRLLAFVDPHRARWAIQHVPYPVAQRMRVKDEPTIPLKALRAWESWVLEAAWARLLGEGRLTAGRPVGREIEAGALR